VLPFVNTSGDPQMDYFGDGITESLILGLSRLPQLKVTAQSSVFRYRGQTDRALEIGTHAGRRGGAHRTRAAARQRAADLGGAG
jgi:TolB-like protein